jgi:hypothetical protein
MLLLKLKGYLFFSVYMSSDLDTEHIGGTCYQCDFVGH